MVRLKHVDHRLAAGILRDCRASNPEVRLEEILVVLTRIVLRGIPAHIKNPNGWLRAEAAGAVRKEYLAALDRRGAALMAAAGRVKQ